MVKRRFHGFLGVPLRHLREIVAAESTFAATIFGCPKGPNSCGTGITGKGKNARARRAETKAVPALEALIAALSPPTSATMWADPVEVFFCQGSCDRSPRTCAIIVHPLPLLRTCPLHTLHTATRVPFARLRLVPLSAHLRTLRATKLENFKTHETQLRLRAEENTRRAVGVFPTLRTTPRATVHAHCLCVYGPHVLADPILQGRIPRRAAAAAGTSARTGAAQPGILRACGGDEYEARWKDPPMAYVQPMLDGGREEGEKAERRKGKGEGEAVAEGGSATILD
ncbi:hypothetical protein DFH09DRAFT_1093543 [Mycena vulgaris]|nr:hypothetical protein DFH09DRAFT_1093543 [Mycena vulgaris]